MLNTEYISVIIAKELWAHIPSYYLEIKIFIPKLKTPKNGPALKFEFINDVFLRMGVFSSTNELAAHSHVNKELQEQCVTWTPGMCTLGTRRLGARDHFDSLQALEASVIMK